MTNEMNVRDSLSRLAEFMEELNLELVGLQSIIRCAFVMMEEGCLGEAHAEVENVLLYIDSRLVDLQEKYGSVQSVVKNNHLAMAE